MHAIQQFLGVCFVCVTFATGSVAQATLFDGDLLRQACLQGQCEEVLSAEVRRLQRNQPPGAEFNSQLGAMAAILFDAAQIADGPVAGQIARALLFLAGFSSDVAQRDSLLLLANAVFDGSANLFDLDQPFAASPN